MASRRDDAPPVTTRELVPGLWLAEHPLRAMGMEVGRRMSVVRLGDGGLWLHSVCRLTANVRAWLDGLGAVRFVVSPSRTHHRWMEDYRDAYPNALLVAPPGLAAHRSDLDFDRTLGNAPDPAWTAELDQLEFPIRGDYREIVFLHRSTGTLILTDLCFNMPAGRGLATSLAARLLGYDRKLGVSRLIRALVADRAAAHTAARRILAWDFDRVIVGHGDVIESGGHAAVERAFAWLQPTG